jgi:TPR repeat protein
VQRNIFTNIGIFDLNRKMRTMKNLLLITFLICLSKPVSAQENCKESKYLDGAINGSASEQFLMGYCWETNKNYTEAFVWYRKAAEQGGADAQYTLGIMYANGKGVPQNDTEAIAWYRKAAEQGLAAAQYNLGIMYGNGQGVPQSHEKCYIWSSLASANGIEKGAGNRDICAKKLTHEGLQNAQKEAAKLFELYR